MTQRFGKLQNIWEMVKIFVKWLKYMGTVQIFEVRHRYIANDLNILNMASMRG